MNLHLDEEITQKIKAMFIFYEIMDEESIKSFNELINKPK